MRSIDYHILTEHIEEQGCVICRLVKRAGHKRMDSLYNEYVADLDTNNAFRAARGLCNQHAWQAKEDFYGYVTGIVILTHASLDEVLDIIEQTDAGPRGLFKRGKDQRAEALAPVELCPICTAMDEAENRFCTAFANHFDEPAFTHLYHASEGVCVPHTRVIISLMPEPDAFIDAQVAKWVQLRDALWHFLTEEDSRQKTDNDIVKSIRALAGLKGAMGQRRTQP